MKQIELKIKSHKAIPLITILENINVDIKEVNKFVASSAMESNEGYNLFQKIN